MRIPRARLIILAAAVFSVAVTEASAADGGPERVRDLTLEAALRMAAERDPGTKAVLAEFEAAGAARRQERLLLSPEAEGSVKSGGGERRYDLAVTEDLSGLLLYPLKWGLAGSRYREAKLQAAIALADRQLQVKRAYREAQALDQSLAIARAIRENAEAAAELAERQRKAGNINLLQQAVRTESRQDAVLEYERLAAEADAANLELASLIGMADSPEPIRIADTLPPIPAADPAPAELIRMALGNGLEPQAADAAAISAGKALWLARLSILPLRAGIEWEREGSEDFLGPKLEVQVPLDLGWNAASKSRWEREAAGHKAKAAEQEARARVRALHGKMAAARRHAAYLEREVVPHRQAALEEMLRQYNFMLEGVYELIHGRDRVYEAQLDRIGALKEYWTARAEMERVLGGTLPVASGNAAAVPEPAPPQPALVPQAPAGPGHDHDGSP